jgi:hypothetical protein
VQEEKGESGVARDRSEGQRESLVAGVWNGILELSSRLSSPRDLGPRGSGLLPRSASVIYSSKVTSGQERKGSTLAQVEE